MKYSWVSSIVLNELYLISSYIFFIIYDINYIKCNIIICITYNKETIEET